MGRKTPFDLIGGAYSDDALPWSAQDCVNYIPVFAEKGGTRSPKMLRGAPGWSVYSDSMEEGPIRGTYDCEGLFLAVAGNTLYSVDSHGLPSLIGSIPGTERVKFAHNQVTGGHQVAIGNGQSGYVFDTSDSSFAQITDEGFPGFRSVDFIDQYIIGVEPFGRYWFHSDLSDATAYNTLDRYSAEKSPDLIQQVIASGGDVFALGQRKSQFFYNSGADTGTFANRPGTEMDIGAASPWTACRLDNTVYWLGHDGTVYRLEGNQPRRVSTHALEQAFSRADISRAYAYTFEDRGHKIYYLTVGGRTWGFDVATGEWHRRKSHGLDFLRFSSLTQHRRRWIGGDYTNGKLYLLDWTLQSEAGDELERSRISPVLHDSQNRVICNLLELVFDNGLPEVPMPEQPVGPSISGAAPDGITGVTYGPFAYTITEGDSPIVSVVIISGELPDGLTLDNDGEITGTPTEAGSFSITVRVTDANGLWAELQDTILVTATVYATAVDGLLHYTEAPYAWTGSVDVGPSVAQSLVEVRNGKLFAFYNSDDGASMSSDYGATWTPCTGLPSLRIVALVFSNDTYIAVPESGTDLYVSSDGIAFSAHSYASDDQPANSAIAIDDVVIVGRANSSQSRRSVDGGTSWANCPLVSAVQAWAFAHSDTSIVACTNANLRRSANGGASWSTITDPLGGGNLASVAYGNGIYLAVNSAGDCAISEDDGVTWEAATSMPETMGTIGDGNEMVFDGANFIAAGTSHLYTTADGVTWTERTALAATAIAFYRSGQ